LFVLICFFPSFLSFLFFSLPFYFIILSPILSSPQSLFSGEQQRLAFARLFFHRPRLAFLDECTSALDAENETNMYRSLLELNIPYLSIAHKNTLLAYHNKMLRLDGQGGWQLDHV
jgi:putative ATP-binding cassette transporter